MKKKLLKRASVCLIWKKYARRSFCWTGIDSTHFDDVQFWWYSYSTWLILNMISAGKKKNIYLVKQILSSPRKFPSVPKMLRVPPGLASHSFPFPSFRDEFLNLNFEWKHSSLRLRVNLLGIEIIDKYKMIAKRLGPLIQVNLSLMFYINEIPISSE